MRHLITIGLIFIILSCGNTRNQPDNSANDTQQPVKPANGYKVYSNKDEGFCIFYPEKWDTTSERGPSVIFHAFEINPDTMDKFNEGLVITGGANEGLTRQQVSDKQVQLLKENFGDLEINQTTSKNENGLDYINLEFTQVTEGISITMNCALFDNGTNTYCVIQSVEPNKKDQYTTIKNIIVNSFNWTTR